MRVLVLLTDAFGGIGGIARFNRDLLKALCDDPSCEKVVAIPRLVQEPIEEKLPSKLTYVTNGLDSKIKYVMTVFKTLRRNPKFDVVIFGHIHLLSLAFWIRLLFGSGCFCLVLYGVDAWKVSKHWFANLQIRKMNAVISISQITLERFSRWTGWNGRKTYLLPPAIRREEFSQPVSPVVFSNRYGLKNKKVMLSLARLSAEDQYKGIDEVIDVMPDLLKEIPNLVYLIVGDGTDRCRLEEKVSAKRLTANVIFAGFVPESEKVSVYRLADVFVMPGWGEGFGIVYLEAMACGVPVVGSKRDGSKEALRNGELGILVDPANREELKTGILEALKVPKGTVPEGLDYFSFRHFEERCRGILSEVLTCR